MSAIKYFLVLVIFLFFVSLPSAAVAGSASLPSVLKAPPQSDYLCPALTAEDIEASELSFGLDLQGSRGEYERILQRHPYIGLGILLFAPVDGWLQSHAGRGSASGTFSFDASALDLHAVLSPVFDSYDDRKGFALDAFENIWDELDRSVNEVNASFSGDAVIQVEFSVDSKTAKTDLPRVRIDVFTEVLDFESRTILEKAGTRQTYYLSLAPTELESFPVMSAFAVNASAHLYRFELEGPVPMLLR